MLWPNAKGSRRLSSAGEHVERSEPGEASLSATVSRSRLARQRLPRAAPGSEPSWATSSVTDGHSDRYGFLPTAPV